MESLLNLNTNVTIRRSFLSWILMLLIVSFVLATNSSSADKNPISDGTSKIIGEVADAETGEPIVGATVMLKNTTLGCFSDLDGNFTIKKVPFGYYTIVISAVGYNNTEVTSVGVTADQNTKINVLLKQEAVELEGITVTAKAVTNTKATVLLQRKNSIEITDGISSEEISRSRSSDAAEAVKKVTGASVVSGKYVYIRGLGDRYANTKLNGSVLPSPDPDKQAVPMDLVPTSLLDNIVVEKTFTPDKPGDFAGGSVNLGTKDYPENRSLKITMGSGYNTITTFDNVLTTDEKSSSDWLGYDNGARDIPQLITDNSDIQAQVPEGVAFLSYTTNSGKNYDSIAALAAYIDEASKSFTPEMEPKSEKAPLNQSYSVSYGDQWSILNRPLGIISSLSYNRKYSSYTNGFSGKYKLGGAASDSLSVEHELTDTHGKDEVLWGGLLTLKYGIHRNHKLGLSYMRNQNGETETRYLDGVFPEHVDLDESIVTRALVYKERRITSLQFNGEHVLWGKSRIDWNISRADTKLEEPDTRFFTNQLSPEYVENEDTGDLEPTGNYIYSIQAGRFPVPERAWRKLEEENQVYNLDITIPLSMNSKFKTGTSFLNADRSHQERSFDYIVNGRFDGNADHYAANVGLDRIDTSLYYHDGTVDTTYKWIYKNSLLENVEKRNQYTGTKEIFGAYGMLEFPILSKLKMVTGVRYEKTFMYSVSQDANYDPGQIKTKDILPSINFIYKMGTDINYRVSYGRTLARPNFREISPAVSEEFGLARQYTGNPALKRTLIDNYDIRWEWFIRPGEILAISGFYKYFKNPIELSIVDVNGNLQPLNVDRGKVYGIELEFRRNLSHVHPNLSNFNLGGNLTLVKSVVDVPQIELDNDFRQNPKTSRPMEGQSPYIINVDFGYNNLNSGTTFSLYYNLFGKRLAFNSTNGTPDVYEQPRNQLDFLASRRFIAGSAIKFSVKNILAQDAKFVHENIGLPAQQEGKEYIYQEYKVGTEFSLGITYQVW